MRRALIASVIAATFGCTPTPSGPPPFDSAACAEFAVLQRMGLSWDRLNHRISTWSVGFDHDACRAHSAEITHIGGNFSTGSIASDVPGVEFGWQRVATQPESVGVARVAIESTLDGEPRTAVTETFDRSALGLTRYERVVALIDGLHFETGIEQDADYPADYDPDHGYTVRGFGASAAVTSLNADELALRADLHFQPANSPDRADHNAAFPQAQIAARLDVLLVGIGNAELHEGDVSYEMLYPEPVPTEDQEIPPPGPEKTRVEITGKPGSPDGFWGLTGFDFDYRFDGRCEQTNPDCAFFAGEVCEDDGYCSLSREEPGEYLREISVGVERTEYDPETGAAVFSLEGYTSNASNFVANYALDYAFSGGMAWIQAPGAAAPQTLTETFETGSTSYELD